MYSVRKKETKHPSNFKAGRRSYTHSQKFDQCEKTNKNKCKLPLLHVFQKVSTTDRSPLQICTEQNRNAVVGNGIRSNENINPG